MTTLNEKITPSLKHFGPMTEEEFLAWYYKQTCHAEWVEGEVTIMSPISGTHDDLQWWLRTLLQFYVKRRGLGRVRGQFAIRLPSRRLEPDIFYITADHESALLENHFEGPPDLAIEIVSPESQTRDWRSKYEWYEEFGVREYWVIDPKARRVEAYARSERGKFERIAETGSGADVMLVSKVVSGWRVKTAWLWQVDKIDVLDALKELDA